MNTAEEFKRIADNFHRDGDYQKMYRDYAVVSKFVWEDTTRKDYQADLWYYLNCNEICLEMLGNICKDKRVLSIGGGFWIEKVFLEAIKAREILRTDIVPDEGVLQEDAQHLSFPDASFDIVVCRELIEHVPDEQKVFDEIKRVLRPHGYLLITTPNCYSISIDGTFHVRGYTPTSFLTEMEEQDFSVIKKRGNVPYCFHGLKLYLNLGLDIVLDDFKKIDGITREDPYRYYLGTQLFVLARKK